MAAADTAPPAAGGWRCCGPPRSLPARLPCRAPRTDGRGQGQGPPPPVRRGPHHYSAPRHAALRRPKPLAHPPV
eukprot:13594276-Alexandrium_andersonii.AAC.1